MTKQEAAIVSAYTGIMVGNFSDLHQYVEVLMGRPVFTHEMGNKKFADSLKDLARDDFMSIVVE